MDFLIVRREKGSSQHLEELTTRGKWIAGRDVAKRKVEKNSVITHRYSSCYDGQQLLQADGPLGAGDGINLIWSWSWSQTRRRQNTTPGQAQCNIYQSVQAKRQQQYIKPTNKDDQITKQPLPIPSHSILSPMQKAHLTPTAWLCLISYMYHSPAHFPPVPVPGIAKARQSHTNAKKLTNNSLAPPTTFQ